MTDGRLPRPDRFDPVARHYDLANRLLSVGLDRWWRRQALAALASARGSAVIDLCCGTGDLALGIAASGLPQVVVGLDVSPAMLGMARSKLARDAARVSRAGRTVPPVALLLADVRRLPFPDAAFDSAVMGFGLRNVADRDLALAEAHRVLAGNGLLVVLEFVPPAKGFCGKAVRLWIERAVPGLGGVVTGGREPYSYLRDSILSFPPPDRIAEEIRSAGFAPVSYRPLFPGVAGLWVARATGAGPSHGAQRQLSRS